MRALEAVVELPFADERFEVAGHARWRDGTQLPFYGLGDDSLKDQRTAYALQTVDLGASATFRPSRWFSIGAGASAMLVENSDGRGRFPSIETVFDPSTAPGLLASPDYLHAEATAAVDWRESEGYTRRGGYYAVTVHRYDDRSDHLYTFNEVEADVQHGETTRLGDSTATEERMATPGAVSMMRTPFLRVDVAAVEGAIEPWTVPLSIYFRRNGDGDRWRLVGLERASAAR